MRLKVGYVKITKSYVEKIMESSFPDYSLRKIISFHISGEVRLNASKCHEVTSGILLSVD